MKISTKFGFNWTNGFREDWNINAYRWWRTMTMDAMWWQYMSFLTLPFSSSQVKLIYPILKLDDLVWFMVLKVTFNNISVIAWQYVLLVEETRVPEVNHWPAASNWQTLSHNVVSSTPRHERWSNSQF